MLSLGQKKVVLREDRTEEGYFYLGASLNDNGDIEIEGQDLGPRVKELFDCIEYEWKWTIKRQHINLLKFNLSSRGNILLSLKRSFANENATNLYSFLCDCNIPFETWSRTGD